MCFAARPLVQRLSQHSRSHAPGHSRTEVQRNALACAPGRGSGAAPGAPGGPSSQLPHMARPTQRCSARTWAGQGLRGRTKCPPRAPPATCPPSRPDRGTCTPAGGPCTRDRPRPSAPCTCRTRCSACSTCAPAQRTWPEQVGCRRLATQPCQCAARIIMLYRQCSVRRCAGAMLTHTCCCKAHPGAGTRSCWRPCRTCPARLRGPRMRTLGAG